VPANLPATRAGSCLLDLKAHAGTVNITTSATAEATCTVDSGHTTFEWSQDVVANGLVTRRVTLKAVLQQRLSVARVGVTDLSVTVQEGEVASGDGGADAGKVFAKTAIWTMPKSTCSLVGGLREYWGIKSSPGDYRYTSTISCTENAAPSSTDAQPNALQIDQLTTFTVVQD